MKLIQIYVDGRWRYVTAIVDRNITYSMHSVNALPETYLEICKALCPTQLFRLA